MDDLIDNVEELHKKLSAILTPMRRSVELKWVRNKMKSYGYHPPFSEETLWELLEDYRYDVKDNEVTYDDDTINDIATNSSSTHQAAYKADRHSPTASKTKIHAHSRRVEQSENLPEIVKIELHLIRMRLFGKRDAPFTTWEEGADWWNRFHNLYSEDYFLCERLHMEAVNKIAQWLRWSEFMVRHFILTGIVPETANEVAINIERSEFAPGYGVWLYISNEFVKQEEVVKAYRTALRIGDSRRYSRNQNQQSKRMKPSLWGERAYNFIKSHGYLSDEDLKRKWNETYPNHPYVSSKLIKDNARNYDKKRK